MKRRSLSVIWLATLIIDLVSLDTKDMVADFLGQTELYPSRTEHQTAWSGHLQLPHTPV